MPSPPFDTVLFDLSGTLFSQRALFGGFRRSLANLARSAGIAAPDDATLRAAYRDGMAKAFVLVDPAYYAHRDLFRGAFEAFLEVLGAPTERRAERGALIDAALDAQLRTTLQEARLRPGVTETLGALRAAGVHVGLVSNMDDDYFEPLLDSLGLRGLIDAGLSSEAARSCKPHRAIYERALDAAGGHGPERAVFVGDTPAADIAGPNRLGFTSVLILEEGHEHRPSARPDEQPDHVIRSIPEILPIVGIEP
jgi:HAD superfamily hydrolase (TIGR01509 family)